MSRSRQIPRSETIWEHYQAALHNDRRATIDNITRDAVESYIEGTTPQSRRLKLMVGNDAANAKKIHRWLDPLQSGDLPADLEEHVVEALPEPYRSACIRDLAARYNLSATPIPDASGVASCKDVGRVMKECGEAIQAASSEANAREVVRESVEAIESLLALIAAHESKPLRAVS